MPCEKVNHVCDKAQYREASFLEKITLRLHIVYCKACRSYTKNNTKLTKILKRSNLKCLDKDSKESMKKTLKEAMKEHSV